MAKDQYSGAPRKTSGVRRGVRDRIVPPSYSTKSLEGKLPTKDADDALSGHLIQQGVIAPRTPAATSNIREYIRNNMQRSFNAVTRAGETDYDAGNAIRARMNQRLVPQSFTLRNPLKGKSGLGTMERGSQVKIAGVHVRDGALRWTVKGRTANGRHISNDVHDDVIGRLYE